MIYGNGSTQLRSVNILRIQYLGRTSRVSRGGLQNGPCITQRADTDTWNHLLRSAFLIRRLISLSLPIIVLKPWIEPTINFVAFHINCSLEIGTIYSVSLTV